MENEEQRGAIREIKAARERFRKAVEDGSIDGDEYGPTISFLELEGVGLAEDGSLEWLSDDGQAVLAIDPYAEDSEAPRLLAVSDAFHELHGTTWGIDDSKGSGRCVATASLAEAMRIRASAGRAVFVLDDSKGWEFAAKAFAGTKASLLIAESMAEVLPVLQAAGIDAQPRGDVRELTAGDLARARSTPPGQWNGLLVLFEGLPYESRVSYGIGEDGLLAVETDGGALALIDPDRPRGERLRNVEALTAWGADRLRGGTEAPMAMVSTDLLDALILTAEGHPSAWVPSWEALAAMAPTSPMVLVPSDLAAEPSQDSEAAKAVETLGRVPGAAGAVQAVQVKGAPGGFYELLGNGREYTALAADAVSKGATQAFYARTSEGYHLRTSNHRGDILAEWGKKRPAYPTGLKQLDELLDGGLTPSTLYFLGAPSNVGKTTLALQIACNIAEQGRDVLYITTEQDRPVLLAKTAARLTYRRWLAEGRPSAAMPLTASEVLRGELDGGGPEWQARAEAVKSELFGGELGRHLMILRHDTERTRERWTKDAKGNRIPVEVPDPDGTPGVDTARRELKRLRKLTGSAPVLFVDYLQILHALDEKADAKAVLDACLDALTQMAAEFDTPVFVISALNREAQRRNSDVRDLNAYSGSGNIEYRGDVALALRYGYEQTNREPCAEILADAATYAMDLTMVKSRLGSKGRAHLRYVAPYDHFEDDMDRRYAYDVPRDRPIRGTDSELEDIDARLGRFRDAIKEARQYAAEKDEGTGIDAVLHSMGLEPAPKKGRKPKEPEPKSKAAFPYRWRYNRPRHILGRALPRGARVIPKCAGFLPPPTVIFLHCARMCSGGPPEQVPVGPSIAPRLSSGPSPPPPRGIIRL